MTRGKSDAKRRRAAWCSGRGYIYVRVVVNVDGWEFAGVNVETDVEEGVTGCGDECVRGQMRVRWPTWMVVRI